MSNASPLSAVLSVGPDACHESRVWLATVADLALAPAYYACPDGRWLLWLAARAGVDRRRIVLAACACAELALVHVPAGEDRPRRCIEVTRAWCRGEASLEEVRAARMEARAATADAAYATVAAYAAYAAATAPADAAYAYAYADAAYAAARLENRERLQKAVNAKFKELLK